MRSGGRSSPSVARMFDRFVSDGEPDLSIGETEACRAQPHLRRRLPRQKNRSSGRRAARDAPRPASSSVDLPMPGSPPIRIAEPGTMPPPVTRSSSAMPLEKRGASSRCALQRFELDDAALALPRDAGAGRRTGVGLFDERIPAHRTPHTFPPSASWSRRRPGRRRAIAKASP